MWKWVALTSARMYLGPQHCEFSRWGQPPHHGVSNVLALCKSSAEPQLMHAPVLQRDDLKVGQRVGVDKPGHGVLRIGNAPSAHASILHGKIHLYEYAISVALTHAETPGGAASAF